MVLRYSKHVKKYPILSHSISHKFPNLLSIKATLNQLMAMGLDGQDFPDTYQDDANQETSDHDGDVAATDDCYMVISDSEPAEFASSEESFQQSISLRELALC